MEAPEQHAVGVVMEGFLELSVGSAQLAVYQCSRAFPPGARVSVLICCAPLRQVSISGSGFILIVRGRKTSQSASAHGGMYIMSGEHVSVQVHTCTGAGQ